MLDPPKCLRPLSLLIRLMLITRLMPMPTLAIVMTTIPSTLLPTGSEDLVSARCQSKCLFELEKRHKNNSDTKRQLRHQITMLCKDDPQCSSCILPCRESFFEKELCDRNLCRNVLDAVNCRESCAFLDQVNRRKPGVCPSQPPSPEPNNLECSAFCDTDGDCTETEKCCTVGCSRSCLSSRINDTRLLPIPDGITVQERKRKRSAILRWIMKRMSPQHTSTNSNLFVIQWRWSVHRQPETMSPWQTILVRNKMYAILKHLLAPGRYYTFRVAAVNIHGTYGFSAPSYPPFKLSKEAKAPSAPTNLTLLEDEQHASIEFDDKSILESWHPKIGWSAPASDLPLKDYQLTWWKSTEQLADAYEHQVARRSQQQGKKRHVIGATTPSNDNIGTLNDGILASLERDELVEGRRSTVIPSYSTRAQLDDLDAGEVYLVELYATVESSEGELRGEPAILFIRKNRSGHHLTDSITTTTVESPPLQPTTTLLSRKSDEKIETDDNEEHEDADELDNENEQSPSQKYAVDLINGGNNDVVVEVDEEHTTTTTVAISSSRDASIKPLFQIDHLNLTRFRAEVKTPYFEGGRLKTSISWLDHSSCGKVQKGGEEMHYRIYIRSTRCINELPPQQFAVRNCVATLENLQFHCDYFVKVEKSNGPEIVTQMTFATLPCERTPSEIPLQCGQPAVATTLQAMANTMKIDENIREKSKEELAQISEIAPTKENTNYKHNTNETVKSMDHHQQKPDLNCTAVSETTAECHWKFPQSKRNPIIGYRVLLSSTVGPQNVSIVGPIVKRVQLRSLNQTAQYRFRVQAVTAHGLGAELEAKFNMKSQETPKVGQEKNGKNQEQFFASIELPLESSGTERKEHIISLILAFIFITSILWS